jgi:lysophospholipase L1-like esterase
MQVAAHDLVGVTMTMLRRRVLLRVVAGAAAAISIAVSAVSFVPSADARTRSTLSGVVDPGPGAAIARRVYRIMPLGDSITRGIGQRNAEGQLVGWRERLQQHLDAAAVPAGFRYDFVGSVHDEGARDGDHEGHGGWTIDQVSAQIDGWMAEYRPDVVLLHLGTNDVSRGSSPAVIADKLGRLITRIREDSPFVRIFVARIIGTNGIQPGEKARNASFAEAIPGVVADAGGPAARVYLVDQGSVRGLDIYDYHHPNARGYEEMAFNWYQAMRSAMSSRWRPVLNPYRVKHAQICQYDFGKRRPTCSRRTVS